MPKIQPAIQQQRSRSKEVASDLDSGIGSESTTEDVSEVEQEEVTNDSLDWWIEQELDYADQRIPLGDKMENETMSDSNAGVTPLLAGAALFGNRGYDGHRDHGHDHLAELIQSQGLHNDHSNIQSDVADAARDSVDAVRDGITATNQIGNLNLAATERNGGETRSTVFQANGAVKDQAAVFANQTARDFANQNREICEIRSEMAQQFGETRLKSAEQHAAAILKATEQHCALQAQIAACCCETKELIRSENSATRELIQAGKLDDANRRTAEVERELLLAKLQASNGPGNS